MQFFLALALDFVMSPLTAYRSSLGVQVRRQRRLGGRGQADQFEASADAGGGEDGEPGEDGRAEQDEADGDHPQLLVGVVEGERPPREQRAAAHAGEEEAAVGSEGRPRPVIIFALPAAAAARGSALGPVVGAAFRTVCRLGRHDS
ncbi:hypothetical protein Cni_G08846 [Canna indica]|uniref:Uncharacterized protein n=1 Tax=Canna indica TaxID=4628 RepID=A0AAQ3Q8S8_9LILI|nr:hypothetical protein Cni_G08846 [Canna indica]